MSAQVDEQQLIKLQPFGGGFGFEIIPTVALRQIFLGVGLFSHLEKEQVSQFSNVLVISNAIILEHVAEIPQLGDDIVRDSVLGRGDQGNILLVSAFASTANHGTN